MSRQPSSRAGNEQEGRCIRTTAIAAALLAALVLATPAQARTTPSGVGPKCRHAGAPVLCAIHVYVRRTNHALARIGQHKAYHWIADRSSTSYTRRVRILHRWQRRWIVTQAYVKRMLRASDPVTLGRSLAASYGWQSGSEWSALYTLWDRESHWNPRAMNTTSGACGVPQFVPCRDWGDTRAQIRDGLRYIEGRYGRPTSALAHSDAYGWY